MDSERLKGKVALITGAASGIGRATAARFLAEGAVAVQADLPGALGAPAGEGGLTLDCDVTDPAQVEAAIAEIARRYGRLDVIVNNAGITGAVGRIHEYDLAEWQRVLATNVTGAFLTMRYGIPLMLESGGGSIVNVASVGSFVFAGGSAAYTPSKGALLMLTRQGAIEYVKDGIRVNAVCPGLIDTPILDGAPITRDELGAFVPAGRVGSVDEITPLIAYLASDEASYTTGASFLIDGGLTAV